MVKVSVILTTYNSEKTIQRALDSIFSQNGLKQEFEIDLIVVDDCSTDQTISILDKNKVNYISTGKNSGGPNKGRNLGLSLAQGEYICIMDHDDEWLPQRIQTQLKAATLAPIVSCGYIEFSNKTGKIIIQSESTNEDKRKKYPRNSAFLTFLTRNRKGQKLYFGSLMFHKSTMPIFFEEHFGKIDFDWILRLLLQRETVEVCEPLYLRYVEEHNLSLNLKYRVQDFYYSLMTIEQYEKDYPTAVRIAYLKIHGSRARYHYLIGDMKKARFYFIRAEKNLKNFLYFVTTYVGSKWVKKKFKVF